MRVLLNIISIIFLSCSITTLPIEEVYYDDDDTTDSPQPVPDSYGSQKRRSDKNISTWNKTSLVNLEETVIGSNILEANSLSRSAIADESLRWPNGTVPYRIVGPYDTAEQDMIRVAMETIEYWTCVRFVSYNGEEDYISIESRAGEACHSMVGCQGGHQVVALEAYRCFEFIGTVIHELLHALGMIHEHNRPDRDKYINIYKINMDPANIERDDINFGIYNFSEINDDGVPYDYNSVMHYSSYSSSYNGNKTVEPKFGAAPIGQREGLSIRDAITVMIMYNCFYNIDDEFTSRVLPNANETRGMREQLWNTFFRNFNYTNT